jgi:cytochrome c oxidase cbb3-type subunit 3/ubiquinol-cytochrome c reductase cytochrome c subunit
MKGAKRIGLALAGLGCMALVLSGCRAPGKPGPDPEVMRPEQVQDFATLYKENCAACHGEQGRRGNAISLANPVYLALAGREVLVSATAKGGEDKLMPAYAKSQGGTLTDRQIEILVDGMVRNWGRPGVLAGVSPPPYAATAKGDAASGQTAFNAYCARCHGDAAKPAGGQPRAAGPVTDPNYLALISDQSLRSTILAGKPDDGMPDWRGFGPRPLTDQEVTDIVAWLATQRRTLPGQRNAQHP